MAMEPPVSVALKLGAGVSSHGLNIHHGVSDLSLRNKVSEVAGAC